MGYGKREVNLFSLLEGKKMPEEAESILEIEHVIFQQRFRVSSVLVQNHRARCVCTWSNCLLPLRVFVQWNVVP